MFWNTGTCTFIKIIFPKIFVHFVVDSIILHIWCHLTLLASTCTVTQFLFLSLFDKHTTCSYFSMTKTPKEYQKNVTYDALIETTAPTCHSRITPCSFVCPHSLSVFERAFGYGGTDTNDDSARILAKIFG